MLCTLQHHLHAPGRWVDIQRRGGMCPAWTCLATHTHTHTQHTTHNTQHTTHNTQHTTQHTHTHTHTCCCCCCCCWGRYTRRPRSPLTRRRIIPFWMDHAPMDLYKMGAWENNFVKYKKQPEKTTKKKLCWRACRENWPPKNWKKVVFENTCPLCCLNRATTTLQQQPLLRKPPSLRGAYECGGPTPLTLACAALQQ